jgi:dinuclear metal center YbgI/SA1388 family protein
MTIAAVIEKLENLAPPAYQEAYDNAGLITGQPQTNCIGVLCTLDCTEAVVAEAIAKGCNLIVAHHPIVFSGLKQLTGKNYVEKTIIAAIRQGIAIYAIHTNLDNVLPGVNQRIAQAIGLSSCTILQPKAALLTKFIVYVPQTHVAAVQEAIFASGGGQIGNYSECSFSSLGTGTFKGGSNSNPQIGSAGLRETLPEHKLEVLIPNHLQQKVLAAAIKAHPYEEVAYEFIPLANKNLLVGSGLVGLLPEPIEERTFLNHIKQAFNLKMLKHTPLLGKKVQKIAICGGAGSFLTKVAQQAGADVYLTADLKYHEFFDAEGRLLLLDIGHWESEQFTIPLLAEFLQDKFPTFAVLKSATDTNPVQIY